MYSEVVKLTKLIKALSETIQGWNYNNFHTGNFQPLLRYDYYIIAILYMQL